MEAGCGTETFRCIGRQRGTSRSLLGCLSGQWAWELGCSQGLSQPTPRAPGAGLACPPDPAEARNRYMSRGAPAVPTPLCLPVAGGNPAGALTGACWCPRTPHMPPPLPHPCTHSCVPAHLVTLGRPSADALLLPCSSSQPGPRRAAYSALALIQGQLGRCQRRPLQLPAGS